MKKALFSFRPDPEKLTLEQATKLTLCMRRMRNRNMMIL